jgi:hypothetical protein
VSARVPRTRPQEENRRRFLVRLHHQWIAGVLERSLREGMRLSVDLQECPEAVGTGPRETARPAPLPAGTRLLDVYGGAGGALLVLGEAGSGKTTLLLDLLQALLVRATADALAPLPVVVSLAGWEGKQGDLAGWLVDELSLAYQVPRRIAQGWVAGEQLALLLDGLDAVPEGQRAGCASAISAYTRAHPSVPVVLTCRRAEEVAGEVRVAVRRAVQLQPLTPDQVDAYLSYVPGRQEGVEVAQRDDPELHAWLATPLLLCLVCVLYEREDTRAHVLGGPERRQQLLLEGKAARSPQGRGQRQPGRLARLLREGPWSRNAHRAG